MRPRLFPGCSGWNFGDPSEKGGWLNVFYPDNKTRKLNYYSQFFDTVEMDATFYKKFYEDMTLGLFRGITKATSDDFKISVKVPETIQELPISAFNYHISRMTLWSPSESYVCILYIAVPKYL